MATPGKDYVPDPKLVLDAAFKELQIELGDFLMAERWGKIVLELNIEPGSKYGLYYRLIKAVNSGPGKYGPITIG